MQHYIIDLSSNNNFVQVPAVQADGEEVRYIEIELIANNLPYVVDASTTRATIIGRKPDGTQIWNPCVITSEGYVVAEISYQMTTAAGKGELQILLMDEATGAILKSFPFSLIIVPLVYSEVEIVSSDEFGELKELLEEYRTIYTEILGYIGDIEAAVSSAATSADESANSAADSAASATESATYATNSANSATASANSATAAANSASDAEDDAEECREIKDYIDDVINNDAPAFQVDFETGHLIYNQTSYRLYINNAGHMIWEVI